jgi:hypothetical protein
MSTTKEGIAPSVAQTEADWYRSIGDQYAAIAAGETWLPRKSANAAEAAKYYGMANAMQVIADRA